MRLVVSPGEGPVAVHLTLAVASAFFTQEGTDGDGAEMVLVGAPTPEGREVAQQVGLPFEWMPAWPSSVVRWRELPRLATAAWAILRAGILVARFRPHAILASDGPASLPVVVAGKWLRVPTLLFVPGLELAPAAARLVGWAQRIAVPFANGRASFPREKAMVTGFPVRADLRPLKREPARQQFGLPSYGHCVLLLAHRDGQAINLAVADQLAKLADLYLLLHACGQDAFSLMEEHRATLSEELKARYVLRAELLHDELVAAYSAADVVVAPAGAHLLAELPVFGLPAILVARPGMPEEWVAGFVPRQGAGIRLKETDLPQGALLATLLRLFNEVQAYAMMRIGMRRLLQPTAALNIVAELKALSSKRR